MKYTELTQFKTLLKTAVVAFLFLGFVSSCKNKKNAEETSTPPKTEQKEETKLVILTPKEFYGRTCGNCHSLYEPSEYSATSWGHILDSMQKRAHISDANKATLYTYLTGDTLRSK